MALLQAFLIPFALRGKRGCTACPLFPESAFPNPMWGTTSNDPMISPEFGNWHGLPPLMVHAGEDEVLREDAVRIDDLAKAAHVAVQLKIYPRMWHVWQLFLPAPGDRITGRNGSVHHVAPGTYATTSTQSTASQMIEITPALLHDEREIELEFVRASGPGGQNVKKVSTAVQLRFDVSRSPSLAEAVKGRLIRLAGNHRGPKLSSS